MHLEEEIKQRKFKDEFHKAEVNLLFTASWNSSRRAEQMKPHSISLQQYNILRILKGQFPNPAPLKLLTERMIDKMSNTSRLVDKLVKKDMVSRQNCKVNRRQVDIKITEQGLKVCQTITDEIENDLKQNQRLTVNEAQELNRLLDKMRS